MQKLFIKLYDFLTAPLYRRLARDLTIQLQEISHSYIDQHERLTAKMVDELLKMHMRLDNQEATAYARDSVLNQSPFDELAMEEQLAPEKIYELMLDAGNSLDVVELCARHNISLGSYVRLEAKYRGCDPDSIRRARMLEATNFELTRALATLLREKQEGNLSGKGAQSGILTTQAVPNPEQDGQTAITAATPVKAENGNGRR